MGEKFSWIDVRAIGVKWDSMPDFYSPEAGIIGQCKVYSCHGEIETLVARPTNDIYATSGQFLSELLEAQAQLVSTQKALSDALHKYVIRLQSGFETQTQIVTLNFDELLEVFNQKAAFSYTAPPGMLRLLLERQLVRNLLRRLYARIATVKKAVETAKPRFCGLSWTRRLWFLMHGSHPPKSVPWLCHRHGFECAASVF